MIINKIKQLNIIKTVSKKTLVIAIAFLVLGLAYSAYASGIIVFRSGGDSLLNLNLSVDNFIEGANAFSDTSGRSNNGTLSNPPSFVNDQNNKENTALNFNGTTDYVLVNNTVVSNPTSLTISAWLKKEVGGGTYECVLHHGSSYGVNASSYWLGVSSDDYLAATIGANTGINWGPGKTNIKVNMGQWYHLLATWDGSVVKIYVNGQYNTQYNLSSYSSLSTPTRIGASDNGSNYQFRGAIQNVSIYNRSFSDNEVKDLYNSTQPKLMVSSLQSGLIGHWTLDADDYDDATKRVTDKTPYENTAINYGATPTTDRNGKVNGAMSFDGVNNDYVDIPNTGLYTNFTFSAWVYNEAGGDSRHSLFSSHWEVVGTSICYFSYGFANQYWRCSASNLVPYNEWTLVTTTWDGSITRHYANGLLVWTDSAASSGTNQSISTIAGYAGRKFKGSISDARIYNRALSGEEVASLYDSYQPSVSGSSLQKGLVLDMPLTSDWTKTSTPGSEIIIDKSPYENNGKNYSAAISDSGMSTAGYGYIADIAGVDSLEPEDITVSAWLNMDTDAPIGRNIWLTKWYGYSMEVAADTRIPYFRLNGPGDVYSSKPLTPGSWNHVVGTYNPVSGARIYLDGELVGSRTTSYPIAHSKGSQLNIGRYIGGIYFKGKIQGVKIYNRALDATEVLSLYDQGR